VVQKRHHSGTLLAMSESIPAIYPEPPETNATDSGPKAGAAIERAVTVKELDYATDAPEMAEPAASQLAAVVNGVTETGGPEGLEPTRYGDWERKGRCIDF
jgi:hypothetical protein